MAPQNKANPASAATREKILDAAEQLLIEKGCSGTSLRAIASSAGVNLAATNYHFGCKEGLFAAVIHRRVTPINKQRLVSLDELEATKRVLSTQEIVEAFLQPMASTDLPEHLPAVIARISSEPQQGIRAILQSEFMEVASRYQTALILALPLVSEEDVVWRFHFLVGGMLHLVGLFKPLGVRESELSKKERFQKLVTFAVAGLAAH
ncbi:MAG: AcrR family transcriptional regulator [Candidatus Azotimanducaceae bacterium]|jgi:AcrR family transcriptional regulator